MSLNAVVVLALNGGCRPSNEPITESPPESQTAAVVSRTDAVIERQVVRFCGDCHAVPRPDSFPKANWLDEVRRGFDFYVKSGRSDLEVPVLNDVVRYYRTRAPEQLQWEVALKPQDDCLFQRADAPAHQEWSDGDPTISFLSAHEQADAPAWWVSDMERGEIALVAANGQRLWSAADIAANPVAVRTCDLDGDQKQDLLVADLGSFRPEDHSRGAVLFVSDWQNSSPPIAVKLLEDVGRVADLRIADLDADGDSDLVVAEFGWHKTGGLHLLTQVEPEADGTLVFEQTQLDDRSGPIHVCLTDLNNDDRPDIVVLVAQEYEQVMAYINTGQSFDSTVLYAAPGPSYGFSGISVLDFDGDGDSDLLYTNGDTFDSFLVKPYHGVSWLENTADDQPEEAAGDVPAFVEHRIGALPGVHRALAGDFDADGDLDVAAVALIPQRTLDDVDRPMESVVWFERQPSTDGSGESFVRHVVAVGRPGHAAMTIDDIDRDGDVDLVIGNFSSADGSAAFTVYRNQTY